MDLLNSTIQCMDAAFEAAPLDFVSNSEILSEIDGRLMTYRKKYGIIKDIGNDKIWDGSDTREDKARKDFDQLEVDIFRMCWEHMKTLILDCGSGDVVREVLASELLGVETSWDKKEANEIQNR